MKYIIIYSECLRSKIIYTNFIKKNSEKIKCLIQVSNYPNAKKKNNLYLFKKIIKSAFSYQIYIFIQVILHSLIAIIFNKSLKKLTEKYKINFLKLKNIPDERYLKKNISDFNKKDIIFCSTMHILKKKHLGMKNVILNFHEAPLPNYKGSALYFHLLYKNEKIFNTCIMQPNIKIDTGKIEYKSKNYNIKNLSVCKLALFGYLLQSRLIFKVNKNLKKIKIKIKKSIYKPYSIPGKIIERKISKIKKNFTFYDYWILIKLSFSEKKLYNSIKQYLR